MNHLVSSPLPDQKAAGVPALSTYGRAALEPAPVNAMMKAFAGDFRDGVDINLGVGYVNEATIPRRLIQEAMAAVIADPGTYRKPFNYGSSEGSANLIGALRRFIARQGSMDEATLEARRMVIGLSGATSILDAIATLLAPGIVIMADPLYYIYANTLERKGFTVLAIPEDDEGPSLEALARALDGLGAEGRRRVSFFYVVTVNNPSCTRLSNARRLALAEAATHLSAEVHRPVPIFFDLAYELLLHDPAAPRFTSALPADAAGVVYEIGTLSKLLAPALRVGYLLGPEGPFINAVAQYTSDVGFSAPLFAQEIAAWLLDHHVEAQLRAVNTGYRAKALAVGAGIERELGPHLAASAGGEAGFYFYLTFKEVETHTDSAFFSRLTRTSGDAAWDLGGHGAAGQLGPRVLTIPGEYCVCPGGTLGAAGRRQLRLSYGYEETQQILDALRIMREAIER